MRVPSQMEIAILHSWNRLRFQRFGDISFGEDSASAELNAPRPNRRLKKSNGFFRLWPQFAQILHHFESQ